jgi:hypothetical protein
MADDTQYVKLPDGSYGAFPSSMKDEEITAAVSKNFPPGAPAGLPPVPKPQVDMQPSFLAHAVSAPKQGIESGMSSPAVSPENAEAMGTGAAIGGVGSGLVSGGVKAIPAITRSLVGAAGGAGLGHYGGGAIGSIFGPKGRELGSQIGATVGGIGGGLAGGFGGPKETPSFVERDATHLNKVPFAGEEMESSAPSWRDATKLNEPYAGEAPEEGWHSRLPNTRPTGTQQNPGATSQPMRIGARAGTAPSLGSSLRPGGSFDLPSTVPEKASVPGAGGESWSMQRKVTPQLQQAAAAGDPGAIQTMRRLNPNWTPVVKPAGAGEYPQTRLGGSFEERMGGSASQPGIASPEASQGLPQGNKTPFQIASPLEKRDMSLEGRTRRAMFEPTASGRTPGQELESTMRQAGNKPPQFSEGQVRQVLTQQGIKDPAWYRQYQNADQRTQGQMIMELVNKMGQR